MEIRALREGDDRSRFHSGDPDLDRFLHRFAGQNPFKHYVGVTYVAVEEDALLGFLLQLALQMACDYGCIGVVVDAKPEAVEFYQQYGFLSVDVLEGSSDARPAPIPMFLAIRPIQGALGVERGERGRGREG